MNDNKITTLDIALTLLLLAVFMTSLLFVSWNDSRPARVNELEPAASSCRSPSSTNERLVVTLYEKEGVTRELCLYYPIIAPKSSKDLRDWKRML